MITPHVRLPGEARVRVEEDEEDPDEGHGHREEHAEGEPHRLEEGGGHHVDEEDGDGQHEVDLLPLLLAPPPPLGLLHRVPGRDPRGLDHGLVHEVPQLAGAPELVGHRPFVLLVLPADPRHHVPGPDRDHVAQADPLPRRTLDQGLPERVEVQLPVPLHLHLEPELLTPHLQDLLPHLTLDHRTETTHELRHGEVVAGQRLAVDLHHVLHGPLALVPPARRVRVHVPDPREPAETPAQPLGDLPHLLVVVAQDGDGVVRRRPPAPVEGRSVAVDPHRGPGELEGVGHQLLLDHDGHGRGLEGIGEGHPDEAVRAPYRGDEAFHLRHAGQARLELPNEVVRARQV